MFVGHEIGSVTDFVTIEEVSEKMCDTIKKEIDNDINFIKDKVEKKHITVDKS